MKNREALLRIYRVILSMNQRNRAVSSAYGTDMSVGASGVLTELLAQPGLSPGELSHRLMVDRVTITRILDPLREERLISEKSDVADARRKMLELTRAGFEATARMRERENSQFEDAFRRLSSKEQKKFTTLMRQFLSRFDSIPVVGLKDDPPLMREIRVLSRAIGLLGTQFFCQDEASPIEWHTLAQAYYSPRGVTSRDLCIRFLVAPTTASSCVARLEKKKFIRRIQHTTDKRMFSLVTTEKGEQFLRRLESHAVGLLDGFSDEMSGHDLDEFANLFEAYSGAGLSSEHVVLGDELLLQLVKGEELLPQLRSFIIQSRTEQGRSEMSHSTIGSPTSYSFLVFHQKKVVAAFEFSEAISRGAMCCLHAFISDDQSHKSKVIIEALVQQVKAVHPSASCFSCMMADCSASVVKALEGLGAQRESSQVTKSL